jgi:hypothetical protein
MLRIKQQLMNLKNSKNYKTLFVKWFTYILKKLYMFFKKYFLFIVKVYKSLKFGKGCLYGN